MLAKTAQIWTLNFFPDTKLLLEQRWGEGGGGGGLK